MKHHLYKVGFKPGYWIWSDHGKDYPEVDVEFESSSSGGNLTNEDNFMSMQQMVYMIF